MATMPARIQSLEAMLPGILKQCDTLTIYLNDFGANIPKFLHHPKIMLLKSEDLLGNLGSSAKFYMTDEQEGYILTIDDDFFYPDDYAQKMIAGIEKYKRKALLTGHGRRITQMPCPSYYNERAEFFQCTKECKKYERIHITGTGVSAWHSDTFTIDLSVFKRRNMCDLFFSEFLEQNGIPRYVVPHPDLWLRPTNLTDFAHTISRLVREDDSRQTEIINRNTWTL